MNRYFIGWVSIAMAAFLGESVRADPIVVTAYLTVGPDAYLGNQTWSGSTTIANPASPQLPVDISIAGPPIAQLAPPGSDLPSAGITHLVATTYDLRIYFGPSTAPDVGGQQSNPYVEITGNLGGSLWEGPSGNLQSGFSLTSMSVVLKNDQGNSSIPPGLLSLFSSQSNYTAWTPYDAASSAGQRTELTIQIDSIPEPSTWLVFTMALAAAVVRQRRRNGRRGVGQAFEPDSPGVQC